MRRPARGAGRTAVVISYPRPGHFAASLGLTVDTCDPHRNVITFATPVPLWPGLPGQALSAVGTAVDIGIGNFVAHAYQARVSTVWLTIRRAAPAPVVASVHCGLEHTGRHRAIGHAELFDGAHRQVGYAVAEFAVRTGSDPLSPAIPRGLRADLDPRAAHVRSIAELLGVDADDTDAGPPNGPTTVEAAVVPSLSNRDGTLQGGAQLALAELATVDWPAAQAGLAVVALDAVYLRPGTGGRASATAQTIATGQAVTGEDLVEVAVRVGESVCSRVWATATRP